jgi:adenine deaminase
MIGRLPTDLLEAARNLARMGGGLAVVNQGKLISSLPLPIAGLLSPMPLVEIASQESALKATLSSFGLPPGATAALLFMTLPVLPQVRLTDHGLVDVAKQQIIPLEAG